MEESELHFQTVKHNCVNCHQITQTIGIIDLMIDKHQEMLSAKLRNIYEIVVNIISAPSSQDGALSFSLSRTQMIT